MSLVRRAIFVLTLTALTSPAIAEDAKETFPERTLDGWRVYGWEDDCWMKKVQADGTQVLLSVGTDNHDLYIVARNEKWYSITSKKSYDVRVVFDSVDIVKQASASFDDELRGIALFVSGSTQSHIPNLLKSKQIELSVGGALITRIPLADSISALRYFDQCSTAIRALATDDTRAYDRIVRSAMSQSAEDAPKAVSGDPFLGREDSPRPALAGPPSGRRGRAPQDPFAGKEDKQDAAVPPVIPILMDTERTRGAGCGSARAAQRPVRLRFRRPRRGYQPRPLLR